ncbi:MAG: DUF349 domain-containing protein [Pseudomonadota bacterium]
MSHTPDKDAVVRSLKRFMDEHNWQDPNWCKVRNQVTRARKAWRQDQSNCEEPLDRAFNTAIGELERKLRPVYEENCARKKAIIQQLRERLDAGVSRVVLLRVAHDLQEEWKAIRPVPRRKDQRLWQDFRGLCDQVFTDRTSEPLTEDTT